MDLALNNLQRLICHKTQQTKPNQTKPSKAGGASLPHKKPTYYETVILSET